MTLIHSDGHLRSRTYKSKTFVCNLSKSKSMSRGVIFSMDISQLGKFYDSHSKIVRKPWYPILCYRNCGNWWNKFLHSKDHRNLLSMNHSKIWETKWIIVFSDLVNVTTIYA